MSLSTGDTECGSSGELITIMKLLMVMVYCDGSCGGTVAIAAVVVMVVMVMPRVY